MNKFDSIKGTSRSRRKASEPTARSYMPGGESSKCGYYFESDSASAFDFGIGSDTTNC